jgi:hypothetical protein
VVVQSREQDRAEMKVPAAIVDLGDADMFTGER